MNCEWKEIKIDMFPDVETLSSYLLWFDKNPTNVVFTIDEVFNLNEKDGKTKLSRMDANSAIKNHIVNGHRLYRKIDVKASSEINLTKMLEVK